MSECKSFYLHGQYFDTFEQLCDFEKEYMSQKIDEKTFDILLAQHNQAIKLNYCHFRDLTNQEVHEIFDSIFFQIIEQIQLKNKNETP